MSASKFGRCDSDLKMYVEAEREVDLRRLRFLRWLVAQGRLEHEVAGPPAGPFVDVEPDER